MRRAKTRKRTFKHSEKPHAWKRYQFPDEMAYKGKEFERELLTFFPPPKKRPLGADTVPPVWTAVFSTP